MDSLSVLYLLIDPVEAPMWTTIASSYSYYCIRHGTENTKELGQKRECRPLEVCCTRGELVVRMHY